MDAKHPAKAWSRIKTVLALSGLAGIAVLAMAGSGSRHVVVHVPARTMPSPNGFDAFVKAGGEVVPGPPMPGFGRADRFKLPNFDDPKAVAEGVSLAKQNQAAITDVERGLSQECRYPRPAVFNPPRDNERAIRRIMNVLVIGAGSEARLGHRREALRLSLDAIAMGRSINQGATVTEWFLIQETESRARDTVWDVVSSLNASECDYALARFKAIDARTVPWLDVLQETKWSTQRRLADLLNRPTWRTDLAALLRDTKSIGDTEIRLCLLQTAFNKPKLVQDATANVDASIAATRKPYGTKAVYAQIGPAASQFSQYYDIGRAPYLLNVAENNLFETAVALQAYRLKYKAYPESLARLAALGSPDSRMDPFVDKPLQYKRMSAGYKLYSVGFDRRNNQGVSVTFQKIAHVYGSDSFLTSDAKGDLVVTNGHYTRCDPVHETPSVISNLNPIE